MTLTHGAEGQHLYRLYLLGKSHIGLEREINMKGYKAFKKGLICKNKKYAENTIFKEPEAIPCECGMHFCKNPMDVFNYYGFISPNGEFTEFAEVEALDEPVTDDNKKYCSTKLKIYEKLSFEKFIDICINSLIRNRQVEIGEIFSRGNCAQIGSFINSTKIISLGWESKIVNSGDYSQIKNLGRSSLIGNSGKHVQIKTKGHCVQIRNSGDYSQIEGLGNFSRIGNSGNGAQIIYSGYRSKIINYGDSTKITSYRDSTKIRNYGDFANITSYGDFAEINSVGKQSVICCFGNYARVKAKKGSYITLSNWEYREGKKASKYERTEYVDGVRIKENTFYTLKNGNFIEVGK